MGTRHPRLIREGKSLIGFSPPFVELCFEFEVIILAALYAFLVVVVGARRYRRQILRAVAMLNLRISVALRPPAFLL